MEDELQTKLFNRMGKQISLTEDGQKLLTLVIDMLKLEDTITHIKQDSVNKGVYASVYVILCVLFDCLISLVPINGCIHK